MIPKKIHYCWFSSEPFPKQIQDCLNSWKIHLHDYELILWDYDAIKNIENIFLQEALFEKKWAFAADFVRLYAVYNHGGIYLDTDVLVTKSFTPLLKFNSFIGRENSFHLVGKEIVSFLSSHCFGAEKGNAFVEKCLRYYDGRSFISSSTTSLPAELKFDMTLLPYIQAVIAKGYGWKWGYKNQDLFNNDQLVIFPSFYFDPSKELDNSYCKHLALGGWREFRLPEEKINLRYKLKWRFIAVLEFILNKMDYVIIKVK